MQTSFSILEEVILPFKSLVINLIYKTIIHILQTYNIQVR